MLLNCGAGKDSWEFLGLQGAQASQCGFILIFGKTNTVM